MSDDERAIRKLVEDWMTATKAGDSAKVLTLMADDVVFMVPGREPFGKEAFAATSDGMKGTRLDGTADIREMEVLGDWARCRTHIHGAIARPWRNFRGGGSFPLMQTYLYLRVQGQP